MTTIEELKSDLKALNERVMEGRALWDADFKDMSERIASLEKKPEAPCPLEEGKLVNISNYSEAGAFAGRFLGKVQVTKDEHGAYLTLRFNFCDTIIPMAYARKMVEGN